MAKTIESTETIETEADQGMRYKVVKGDFGPYPNGTVFGESSFKKLHAIPSLKDVDRDEYHDGLLQRGIVLGVIAPTQDKLSLVEPGPLNPFATDVMSSIRKAHAEAVQNEANRKSVQDTDVKQQQKSESKQ
jgi:hypothetical protein